jgi:hypothetical protein
MTSPELSGFATFQHLKHFYINPAWRENHALPLAVLHDKNRLSIPLN